MREYSHIISSVLYCQDQKVLGKLRRHIFAVGARHASPKNSRLTGVWASQNLHFGRRMRRPYDVLSQL